MRRRNIAFWKMKKYGRVVYQQDYRKLRNAVVSKVRKNKESFFNRIVPSNQKEFWKVIKFLMCINHQFHLCVIIMH